ncbi:MAG: aminotransferase class V-fold PLP-dependent enzyme [Dongiaceae bacterium]
MMNPKDASQGEPLRRHAAQANAWNADHEIMLKAAADHALAFRRTLQDRPQRPAKTFAAMREVFAGDLAAEGCDGAAVIEELVRLAEPGLSAMAGPRFFGWVIGASHPVGVAADWLTAAWGQNTGNHAATPAAAACEDVAAQWLLELLDLPRDCSVGFVTGATVASFTCLAAARGEVLRRVGWDAEAQGLFGAPPVRVLIGDDAHTSIFSALQFLGLGHDRVIRVATDAMGRMRVADFETAIRDSVGPAIAIAQAGQLITGGFDPIGEIAAIAHRHGAWVHVDGAFGLWARACPETARLAAGCEAADSWAVDGHKWLQTPYDCGYAIMRDAEAHRRAMTITASYLPAAAAGERNPSHFVPELSRRARGFATWAMIRALGRTGIAAMVAGHCRLARRMAAALGAEPGIAIENEVELNQVAVRFGAGQSDAGLSDESGDAATRHVIERLQAEGICFADGARWRGRWIMRLSVISWPTTEEDADRSAAAIIAAWRAVQAEAGLGKSRG